MRIELATRAERADRVFGRTLIEDAPAGGPMPPALRELSLMAHYGSMHGFALVAVLQLVEERFGAEAAEEMCEVVDDIGHNGDDGWCADIWTDVLARLDDPPVAAAVEPDP
jgi:hypothetical protein